MKDVVAKRFRSRFNVDDALRLLLDAVRNDTVWTQTKDLVADKGGSVPFDVLSRYVLIVSMRSVLGASTMPRCPAAS